MEREEELTLRKVSPEPEKVIREVLVVEKVVSSRQTVLQERKAKNDQEAEKVGTKEHDIVIREAEIEKQDVEVEKQDDVSKKKLQNRKLIKLIGKFSKSKLQSWQ
ncbi:hypothetical protein L1987_21148 [Smallanthus sonchifolius]|uniref:Uncharacterized protein n=1 Tax=Smallanthus sonchifolius TaxID=185202 RepID=A0ACB9ITS7_9ASTR|nr:hypothetical protein L1987_21148 [Smallanthus sonchifolius]